MLTDSNVSKHTHRRTPKQTLLESRNSFSFSNFSQFLGVLGSSKNGERREGVELCSISFYADWDLTWAVHLMSM